MSCPTTYAKIARALRVARVAALATLATLAVATGPATTAASASTAFDISGCAGTDLLLPIDTGAGVTTPSDCTIGFGSTTSSAQLRLQQRDGYGDAMFGTASDSFDSSVDGGATYPCFPCDGVMQLAFGPNEELWASTAQPDGSIVSVGNSAGNVLVMRFLPDGSLDPGFDGPTGTGNGRVILTAPVGGNHQALDVAVQPDGRIVLAGRTISTGTENAFLLRLDTDGDWDRTFNGDGYVNVDFTSLTTTLQMDNVDAMRIAPDGSIYVAGCVAAEDSWCLSAPASAMVARFTPTGTLDPRFSNDGVWIGNPAGSNDERFEDLVIQPDGKVVAIGSNNWGDMEAVRLTPAGTLDTTFNGTGYRSVDAGGTERGNSVDLDPAGRIVIAGRSNRTGLNLTTVVRLTSTGAMDTSFDTDGIADIPFAAAGTGEDPEAVLALGDSSILVAGYVDGTWWTSAVAGIGRLTSAGAVDNSFGTNGTILVDETAGGAFEGFEHLAPLPDGRVVATGISYTTQENGLLAVLDATGTVSQYANGVNDFDQGSGAFGACLRSTTGSATWTANAACPTTDGAWWNAIPAGTAGATVARTSGAVSAPVTANLRFGARSGNAAPGAYSAPITIEVVAPGLTAPANTAIPTITGTAQANRTLVAADGTWTGSGPITYSYQWRRCDNAGNNCADISGATKKNYHAQVADVGSTLRIVVTASNSEGAASATSNATGVVAAAGSGSLIWATGFEHQTLSAQGSGLSLFAGSANQISTSIRRNGNASLHVVGSSTYPQGHFRSPDLLGAVPLVVRLDFRFEDFGSNPTMAQGGCSAGWDSFFQVFSNNTRYAGLGIATDGRLCAEMMDTGLQASSTTLTLGVWHHLDFRIDTSTPTWQMDYSIDGVPQPGVTNAIGASDNFYAINLGPDGSSPSSGPDVYIDDIAASATSADYPLGPGKVLGYAPASVKAINQPASFGRSTNNGGAWNALAAGDANQTPGYSTLVDEWPVTTGGTADLLRQTSTASSPTLRLGLATSTETTDPDGVYVAAAVRESATGADNATLSAWQGASSATVFNADPTGGTGTVQYFGKMLATQPGGSAWTVAGLNSLQLQLGSSATTPNPWWDSLIAEADFPTSFLLQNTTPPVVTGMLRQGSAISTTDGEWSGTPSAYSYTWYRCSPSDLTNCTQVATGSNSYTLAAGDVGMRMRIVVSALGEGGWQTADGYSAGVVHSTAPTLVYATGFEHGIPAAGSFTVQTYAARSGTYAWRAATNLSSATGSLPMPASANGVVRLAIMIEREPTATHQILRMIAADGSNPVISYDPTTNTLQAVVTGGVAQSSTTTIELRRWYVLDLRANYSAANHVIDWSIDDVPQPQASRNVGAGTTVSTLALGTPLATDSYSVWYDDVAISTTGGDYPIGNGTDRPLLPVATGIHNAPGDFRYGTGAACATAMGADADTIGASALRLDEWPVDASGTRDHVCRVANGTPGSYLEYRIGDSTYPTEPNGLSVWGMISDLAAGNPAEQSTLTTVVDDGGTRTNGAWTNFDPSSQTPQLNGATYARVPVTNNQWTNTILNSMRLRVGGGTVTSGVRTDALLVEVDHPTGDTAVSTRAPVVSSLTGSATVGALLTATGGEWSDSTSSSYSWIRCDYEYVNCSMLEGPTDDGTYTVVAGDLGKTLYLVERADNGSAGQVAFSEPVHVVDGTVTPWWLTGFEHGITADSNNYWSWSNNLAGFSSTAASARSGSRGLRAVSTGSPTQIARNVPAGIRKMTVRTYMRFDNHANAPMLILTTVSGLQLRVHTDNTAPLDRLFVDSRDGGWCGVQLDANVATPPNTWFRLDMRVDTSVAQPTIEWAIDGIAQPTYVEPATCVTGASDIQFVQVGSIGSVNRTVDFDDMIVTADANDFPIGPGRVLPLTIDGTGTHATPGSYRNNGGGAIDGTSCGRLDEVAFAFTDWVYQQTTGAATYLECTLSNAPSTSTARAISGTIAYAGSGNAGAWVRDNVNGTDLAVFGKPGATVAYGANNYATAILSPPGSGWTPAVVDALTARVGGGGTTPQWHAFQLEAEYPDP